MGKITAIVHPLNPLCTTALALSSQKRTTSNRFMGFLNKNWMMNGKLNNVLDKHYQTASNFNMADRNFFFSIYYND